jgi:hypothetical protein
MACRCGGGVVPTSWDWTTTTWPALSQPWVGRDGQQQTGINAEPGSVRRSRIIFLILKIN